MSARTAGSTTGEAVDVVVEGSSVVGVVAGALEATVIGAFVEATGGAVEAGAETVGGSAEGRASEVQAVVSNATPSNNFDLTPRTVQGNSIEEDDLQFVDARSVAGDVEADDAVVGDAELDDASDVAARSPDERWNAVDQCQTCRLSTAGQRVRHGRGSTRFP